MNKDRIQNRIYCLLTRVNPSLNIKLRYYAMNKKVFPDKDPRTFVEKLLWLRIHYYNKSPLVIQCADKVAVRDYVNQMGFGEYLNEVYGVYDDVESIPWTQLPKQFAMKWNFGASYNIICDDVDKLDRNAAKEKMTEWGHTDYYLPYAEMQYKYCKKKILIEKYLDTKQGFLPYDYKFYCFDGKCRAVLLIADRDDDKSKKGAFFSPDWEYLGLPGKRYHEFEELPQAPESFDLMVACAEKLSEGIPFVRVDFYEYMNKPVFGEMTFSPAAGLTPAQIEIEGHEMGEFIDLKKKGKIIC